MPDPVQPRPAASVLLVRDVGATLEVLIVERPARGVFGGLHVFPGGAVDPVDHSALARRVVSGPNHDHEFRAAGLRELAEEVGLALTGGGVVAAPDLRGEELYASFDRNGSGLQGERLVLISRWVTPLSSPVRFDTRFYLAVVEETPPIRLDSDELVGHMWATPEQALGMYERGDLALILPTLTHLRWLTRRKDAADVLASADGADGRTLIEPKLMDDGSLVPIHLPADR
ncbi:MAG TPA: NUDIX domain-containing protein [Acidimicrobiia bacterium]|nr:NUDIX domain-containing protein [Acidimicrobiia bacterium]